MTIGGPQTMMAIFFRRSLQCGALRSRTWRWSSRPTLIEVRRLAADPIDGSPLRYIGGRRIRRRASANRFTN